MAITITRMSVNCSDHNLAKLNNRNPIKSTEQKENIKIKPTAYLPNHGKNYLKQCKTYLGI